MRAVFYFRLPDQLECRHCRKAFVDQNALTMHSKTHEENYPHKCPVCGKTYKMKASLKLHLMSHTGYRPYECEVCGQTYTRRDKLKIHQAKHRPPGVEDAGNGSISTVCSHFELQYDAPVTLARCATCGIVCRTCGMRFLSRKLSRSHTHENLCQSCGRKSLHRKAHIAHERYHAAGVQFKCDPCQFGFIKELDLNLHNKKQHQIPIPPRSQNQEDQVIDKVTQRSSFECNVCNVTCTSKNALAAHIKVEHIRKFECELCNRAFSTKTLLDFHVARHVGNKPHKCNQCEKAFVRKTDLYRHERTHNNSEQVSCELCGIQLKSKRNLQLHMVRHEKREGDDAEVFCDCDCGLRFLRKSHWRWHMKEVHGAGDPTPNADKTDTAALEQKSVAGSKSYEATSKKRTRNSQGVAKSAVMLRKRKHNGADEDVREVDIKLQHAEVGRKKLTRSSSRLTTVAS